MASTRNFGIRSDYNAVRNARHRVPVGEPYEIGSAAKVDPDNPGFLTRPEAGEAPSQISGVVVFEHIQYKEVDPVLTGPQDGPFQYAPGGQYAQLFHGVGTKVWFKAIGDRVLYDGRTQTNVILLADPDNLPSVGDELTPNAEGLWAVAGVGDEAWMVVEQVNPSTTLVEARLTF